MNNSAEQQDSDVADYSSGTSEYDDARVDFVGLPKAEKREKVMDLWRQCFMRSWGASQLKKIFEKLHERVIDFGTTKNINNQVADIEKRILEKKSRLVLLPDHPFKRYWNILIIFLLVYVATYVPYNISFSKSRGDEPLSFGDVFDGVVDFLFFVDIIVNFISSYDDPETNLPVIHLKVIARNYIFSWFFIDLIAVFPV
jgi:hypothetical protein